MNEQDTTKPVAIDPQVVSPGHDKVTEGPASEQEKRVQEQNPNAVVDFDDVVNTGHVVAELEPVDDVLKIEEGIWLDKMRDGDLNPDVGRRIVTARVLCEDLHRLVGNGAEHVAYNNAQKFGILKPHIEKTVAANQQFQVDKAAFIEKGELVKVRNPEQGTFLWCREAKISEGI